MIRWELEEDATWKEPLKAGFQNTNAKCGSYNASGVYIEEHAHNMKK